VVFILGITNPLAARKIGGGGGRGGFRVRRVPCDIDCGVGKQSCVLFERVITSRSSTAAATITEQTCVMRACVRARACRHSRSHSRRARAREREYCCPSVSAENAPTAALRK